MRRLSRNIALMSTLLVILGFVLGTTVGISLVETGVANKTAILRQVAPFAAVIFLATTLALALFWFARLFVRKENRPLVGQLGGPFITASAALFAAYVAFGTVQTQIDLQQQSLDLAAADRIAQRLVAVKEIRSECEKLALRIIVELNSARAKMAPKLLGPNVAVYEISLAALKADGDRIAELLRKVIVSEETERIVIAYLLVATTLHAPITVSIAIEERQQPPTLMTHRFWRADAIRQLNAAIRENLLAVNNAGLRANEALATEERKLLERYRAMRAG